MVFDVNKRKQNNQKNRELFEKRMVGQYPELARDNPKEQHKVIQDFIESKDREQKEHMKKRLEFLTDGIIAIIITLMVLEVPLPTEGNDGYIEFVQSVGIFFLGFFLVASFWYEHFKILADSKWISNRGALLNLIFLAVLALIPILTKWMMVDISKQSVLHYGIAYMVINSVKFIFMLVVRYDNTQHEHRKIYKDKVNLFIYLHIIGSVLFNGILIWVAWVNPRMGLILYIALPLSGLISQMWMERQYFNKE